MYTLLIPTGEIHRESKTGGGPFWDDFWKEKVPNDINLYRSKYQQRARQAKSVVNTMNSSIISTEGKKYYVDVKLSDEKSGSKSNIPKKIWENAGLEILGTKEDAEGRTILTIGGEKDDYEKLEAIIDSSEFGLAEAGSGKVRDMSRELYAVTDIQNKNNTIPDRVDYQLQQLLDQNYTQEFECIIEIHSDIQISEYETNLVVLAQVIGANKIHLRDTELFISNASYLAELTCEKVLQLLNSVEFNYINKIRVEPSFIAQRSTPNLSLNSVSVGAPLTSETVVVIDSGIFNSVFNSLIAHTHNYLPTGSAINTNHGTSVASRLLFGDSFFEAISRGEVIRPSAHLVDVRVLEEKNGVPTANYDSLMKALVDCPSKIASSSIYNFSVAEKEPLRNDDTHGELTQLVDTLVHKHDLLFVSAVGNQNGNYNLGYEQSFNVPDHAANICAPSDAINSLSVGSIAKAVTTETLCDKENHPAPFTRKGGIRGDMKKPELVANGGNVKLDPTGIYGDVHDYASRRTFGVETFTSADFSKDIGTSLSAPLIAREAVLLLDYLRKSNLPQTLDAFDTNKSNLLRALLVHSTSQKEKIVVEDEGLKRAYGFGEPEYQTAIIDDTENQVTIVYANRISSEEKKHKLKIELPEELVGKSVLFTLTFAYNPPVNKNFKEYKLVDMAPSLRLVSPVMDGEEVTGTKVTSLNPKSSWENYRGNDFSTICHYSKKVRALNSVGLEVLVSMTVADYLDTHSGDDPILQDYSFVLTITDLSDSGILRERILANNELEALIENVIEVEN